MAKQFKDHNITIGNVIESPEGEMKWIVTDVHDDVVQAVSFDSENCSATQRLDDYEREQSCACGDDDYHKGEPDEDCGDCHGAGRYTVKVKGWKHSKILAPHVKAFILNGLKRTFKI